METETTDGAAVRLPPPLVYLAAVFAGWVLNTFLLPLPLFLAPPLRITGATIFILIGLTAIIFAGRLFMQTGQDPKPWKPTTEIISTGIYRFTRNPMYMGMFLMLLGVALLMGGIGALLPVPIFILVVRNNFVLGEERFLETSFGQEYLDYKSQVRRWI